MHEFYVHLFIAHGVIVDCSEALCVVIIWLYYDVDRLGNEVGRANICILIETGIVNWLTR